MSAVVIRPINRSGMLLRNSHGILTVRTGFSFVVFLLLGSISSPMYAQVPDLSSVKEAIQRNEADLKFIDVFLTNLDLNETPGSELRKRNIEIYNEAIRRDFFGNLYYLRGEYGPAYREISRSRDHLRDVYRNIIEYYLDTTGILLEEPSVRILRTDDAYARSLLQQGFRHSARAGELNTRATGTRNHLKGNQINLYRQAFSEMLLARRFAVLAAIQSVTPRSEKEKNRYVSYDEYVTGKVSRPQEPDYDKIRKKLQTVIGRGLLNQNIISSSRGYEIRLDLLKIHRENAMMIHPDRESLYFEQGMRLDSVDFQKRNQLPKRNRINRNEIPAEESDPPDLDQEAETTGN